MARLRHANRVHTEHILGCVALVAAVGTIGAISLIDDAHATSQAAVVPAPSDEMLARLDQQASATRVVGAAAQVPSVPARRVVKTNKAKPAKKVFNPITASGWRIPVNQYTFSAVFGQPGGWASGYHTGLDFVTDEYRTVLAPTAGVVVSTQYEGAYGNLVRLRVRPNLEIWFAHLNDVEVSEGQRIKRGQHIGHVGMTGRTTGPHLHLEVRVKDEPMNPADYFWPHAAAQEFPDGP